MVVVVVMGSRMHSLSTLAHYSSMSAPASDPPAGPSASPEKTGDAASPAANATEADGDVKMEEAKPVDPYADVPEHVMTGSVDDIRMHTRLIDNEVKVRRAIRHGPVGTRS